MSGFIDIEHVGFHYLAAEGGFIQALDDVNLSVEHGEFVSFIGPSGCGKTTLLRLLSGLSKPTQGEVRVGGAEVEGPDPSRGVVFQQGSLFPWLTIRQNVEFGLKARGVPKGRRGDVDTYLEAVGVADFADVYPHEVSGGMAQRVAIVRSLINKPDLLLLDEPMGALDAFTRKSLQDLILKLHAMSGTTMILVTHDIEEAVYMSDRIVVMSPRPGRVIGEVPDTLARPRNREGEDFLHIKQKVLSLLSTVTAAATE